MDIRNRRELKAAAGQSLTNAAYDPKKLILIHTGATLALSLILLVLSYILDQQISGTGGLSGVGTRTILETVQSVLSLAQTVALPFWQCGWIYITIRLYRGENAAPGDLLQGFRSFGPVLRLQLIMAAIYYVVSFAVMIVAVILMTTALFEPLLVSFEQMLSETDMTVMDEQIMLQILNRIWPMVLIVFTILAVAILLINYRLRLAQYYVMDHPEQGAVAAIKNSWKQMKGNMFAMFKLDLSFLWFSLLDALVVSLLSLDMILPALGVELPLPAEVIYFGAFVLYAFGQLSLHWWRKDYVDVTYAAAYDALREPEERQI